MHTIRRSTFFLGFLIASLVALIIWYYQKSTSSENGALDLLDRYAEAQQRLRTMEGEQLNRQAETGAAQTTTSASGVVTRTGGTADDLTQIKGIGPGYARLLAEAGITTYAALASTNGGQLREIVGTRPNVEQWIAEAAARVN